MPCTKKRNQHPKLAENMQQEMGEKILRAPSARNVSIFQFFRDDFRKNRKTK